MWPGQSVKHRSIQELAPDSITACIADTYGTAPSPRPSQKATTSCNGQIPPADFRPGLVAMSFWCIHLGYRRVRPRQPRKSSASQGPTYIPGGKQLACRIRLRPISNAVAAKARDRSLPPPKKTTARRLAGRCYSSFSICERLALRSPTPTQHCQTTEGQQADRRRLRN